MRYAKKINALDNVVTAVNDCLEGDEVVVKFQNKENRYTCNQEVPFGHKIAIQEIPEGGKVLKYGESIGSATTKINIGDWVHIHNVKDDYMCLDKDGDPLPGQE